MMSCAYSNKETLTINHIEYRLEGLKSTQKVLIFRLYSMKKKKGVIMDEVSLKLKKSKKKVDDFLTETEWDLLRQGQSHINFTETYQAMKISESRGYKILNNIKRKWEMATNTHNRLLANYKQLKNQKHWMTPMLIIVKPQEPKLESMQESVQDEPSES